MNAWQILFIPFLAVTQEYSPKTFSTQLYSEKFDVEIASMAVQTADRVDAMRVKQGGVREWVANKRAGVRSPQEQQQAIEGLHRRAVQSPPQPREPHYVESHRQSQKQTAQKNQSEDLRQRTEYFNSLLEEMDKLYENAQQKR